MKNYSNLLTSHKVMVNTVHSTLYHEASLKNAFYTKSKIFVKPFENRTQKEDEMTWYTYENTQVRVFGLK
jgi:hypothetical protein